MVEADDTQRRLLAFRLTTILLYGTFDTLNNNKIKTPETRNSRRSKMRGAHHFDIARPIKDRVCRHTMLTAVL